MKNRNQERIKLSCRHEQKIESSIASQQQKKMLLFPLLSKRIDFLLTLAGWLNTCSML